MGTRIVNHYDLPYSEVREQELLDVGLEDESIHRAFEGDLLTEGGDGRVQLAIACSSPVACSPKIRLVLARAAMAADGPQVGLVWPDMGFMKVGALELALG